MSFFAHIAPNFVSSSAALGYNMLPMVSMTGILDQVYSDLSSSVASGTNNGWVIWDDLRAWNTATILADQFGIAQPVVVPTIGGLWNSPYLASLNSWQIGSASLTWTGYIPWGRDFKWSISNVSGSPTDVSFDSGSTWYRAYFSGSGSANYSTATLDRPFSASAGVTTWPLGVYQRNFKYLVIRQNNSSQKKFCILMAAAQDRTGGPTLYMRAYEDWDATNHSGVEGVAHRGEVSPELMRGHSPRLQRPPAVRCGVQRHQSPGAERSAPTAWLLPSGGARPYHHGHAPKDRYRRPRPGPGRRAGPRPRPDAAHARQRTPGDVA